MIEAFSAEPEAMRIALEDEGGRHLLGRALGYASPVRLEDVEVVPVRYTLEELVSWHEAPGG